jgi:endonuclease YncB( thermonuclease family)
MLGAMAGFLLPDLSASFDAALGAAGAAEIACNRPRIIDGDTMDCAGMRIRLASIDAPEMPHHCRTGRQCTPGDPYAARNYLSFLTRGRVECRPVDTDVYGRTVASCHAGGRDLSCAMVEAGRAVRRYGWLWCKG